MKMQAQPENTTSYGLLPAEVWQRLSALQQAWVAAAVAVAGPATTAPQRLEAASQALLDLQTVALEAGLLLAEAVDCRMVLPEPEPEPEPVPQPLSEFAFAAGLAQLQRHIQRGPAPSQTAVMGRGQKVAVDALDNLRARIGGVPAALPDRGAVRGLLAQTEQGLHSPSEWAILTGLHRRLAIELLTARIRAVLQCASHVCAADHDVARRGRKALKQLTNLATARAVDQTPTGLDERHAQPDADWLVVARDSQKEVDVLLGKVAPAVLSSFNVDDAFRRLRQDTDQLDTTAFCVRLQDLLDHGVANDHTCFVRIVGPRLADLQGQPGLTRLATVVQAAWEAEDKAAEAPAKPLDPNWPGFAHTRGKRAVIVGGDRRQERAQTLKERFGLASLDWPDLPKNSPGKAARLINQVKNGNYDLVICLQQFISHSVTEQLFPLKLPGVRIVLARGYGAGQIQLGLERYLLDRSGDLCDSADK